MADVFKTIKVTQNPGGPLQQQLVGAVSATSGAADANKVILTDSSGMLDSSFGGGGGGTSVYVNAVSIANPNFNDTTPVAPGGYTNVIWQVSGSDVSAYYATSGTTVPFSQVLTGTNAGQTLTVGTASLLTYSTGIINANEIGGINAAGNSPAHAGQLLISQLGNTTALWADPFVQGPWINGTSIVAPGAMGDGTSNIQPVFVAGYDGTDMRGFLTDSTGQLKVLVENTPAVTVSGTVAVTQSGSWTVAATQSGTWNIGTVTAVTSITNAVTVTGSVAVSSVSGTVAVTQSTSPWVISGTVTTASESATGSTVPADATYIGWDSSGNLVGVSAANPLPVSATIGGTFTPALTADRTVTGNITGTGTQTISCAGGGTLIFNITGSWTGTIDFQASVDSTNWIAVDASPFQFGNLVSSTTANGQWVVNIGGLNSFRLIGATVTGTALVWLEVGAGPNQIVVSDIIQGNITVGNFPAVQAVSINSGSVVQGAGGTAAAAWYTYVTDGTNILFTSSHPGDVNLTEINGSAVSTAASGIMRIGVTAGDTGTQISSTSDSGTVGLNVHVTNTGGLAGTQYVQGTTVATPTGTMAMGWYATGTVAESLRLDSSYNLYVNLNTPLPAGTNLIGEVEVYNGTNVVFSSTHPGVTQDTSDGTPNTASQPSTAIQVAGWDGSNLTVLSTTSNGYLNTNATVSGTFTPALTSDRTQTGNITAASQSVTISTQGGFSMTFNVTGTWSGTLTPQFLQADGSTWVSTSVYPTLPGGAAVSTITANGQWQTPVGGFQSFRLFSTAFTSGTAVVSEEVGAGGLSIAVHQGTAANLNATVSQGATAWVDNITEIGGSSLSLGQKTSANSIPVVVASDQSSIDVVLEPGNNNIGYVSYQLPTASRMSYGVINFSSSGNTTLVAGLSGQTIRVFRIMFNVGGATNITISDGVTTFSGPLSFSTGGGFVLDFSGDPWYVTGLSNGFVFNSTAAVQVGGTVYYTQS
jgi:hypothetical protein